MYEAGRMRGVLLFAASLDGTAARGLCVGGRGRGVRRRDLRPWCDCNGVTWGTNSYVAWCL